MKHFTTENKRVSHPLVLGEEVREPRRTIPRAIGTALFVSFALYALVAAGALKALGPVAFHAATVRTGAPLEAAKRVRGFGERGDEMALRIFEQQAMAIGRLFTIAANFTDPDCYFVGGGVIEAEPHFRDWFLARVQEHTWLRDEQRRVSEFALVKDLDMAGCRGSAVAALSQLGH